MARTQIQKWDDRGGLVMTLVGIGNVLVLSHPEGWIYSQSGPGLDSYSTLCDTRAEALEAMLETRREANFPE